MTVSMQPKVRAEWVEHDEVAAEAPRSGLSRSDFVLWPFASFAAAQHHTCYWGNSGHGGAIMSHTVLGGPLPAAGG